MKLLILVLALSISLTIPAAELDATAGKEISYLIGHLGSSGCEFNRNGSWYNASRAVSHLNRKYEYLLERDLIADAEAFITLAASESSASGKPYLVRCKGEAEMQSAVWFREALTKFRAQSSNGKESR
jgi:hypothetical protein